MDLQRTPDGHYIDHRPAPVTDLWLSDHLTNVDATLDGDLRRSATLDGIFPALMQQDADAQAIYHINERASFARYYPLLEPADLLPPDFPMETGSWFTIATPAADPSHRTVWTAPYIDPATKLPIVTASTPVYDGTVFRGMIGVDLSLQHLVDHLQTLKTTPHGYAILFDKQGQVVAAPPEAGRDLLGQQAAASAGALLLGKPLGPLVSPALRQTLEAMLSGKSGVDQLLLNNEATLVSYAPLPDLGWVGPCHTHA